MSFGGRDRAEGFRWFVVPIAIARTLPRTLLDSGGTGLTQASYLGV
jgi:hypothetical protein